MIQTFVYVLLGAHFVADFLAQSDWMAINKSHNWWALTVHVTAYVSVMAGVGIAWLIVYELYVTPFRADWDILLMAVGPPLAVWLALNGVIHFAQDAITSRLTSRLWFIEFDTVAVAGFTIPRYRILPGRRHWFFVAIGFDQLLHYITLCATANWWLR